MDKENAFLNKKVKELAMKYKLTQSQVWDIFYSQFKFVSKVMSEDSEKDYKERRSIKLPKIGTFEFNEQKAKKLSKIKDERKNLDQTTSQD